MRAILDTHAFLWFNFDDSRLGRRALTVIKTGGNSILFSPVVAWEIAIKHSMGRLSEIKDRPEWYVQSRLEREALEELPITWRHAVRVAELPHLHRDPFDRMLIAQAQVEGIPIITGDANIARYDVETIW